MTVTNSTVSGSITRSRRDERREQRRSARAAQLGTLGANAGGAGNLVGAFFDGEVTLVNTIVDGPCEAR